MKNCNMPSCNMPRYESPRNMNGEMDHYLRNHHSSCQCGEYPIGMGYVPWQDFRDLHDPEKALHAGTMFIELDKPFTGRRPFRR